MTDPKKLLPGLSVLFGFSVFIVAAILAVTSIFEIALREQVLTLVKSEKDKTYSQLFRQVSLTPALGDERALLQFTLQALQQGKSDLERDLRERRDKEGRIQRLENHESQVRALIVVGSGESSRTIRAALQELTATEGSTTGTPAFQPPPVMQPRTALSPPGGVVGASILKPQPEGAGEPSPGDSVAPAGPSSATGRLYLLLDTLPTRALSSELHVAIVMMACGILVDQCCRQDSKGRQRGSRIARGAAA